MSYDVAARLDRGRPSVADTQTYVTACQAVGYGHPDLTAHGAQILEWYGAEDGLDLDALDADCVALRALADAASEALRTERDGLRALVSAWQGESRSAAEGFIDRHCQSGAAVVGALRTAVDSCSALRDTLIGIVDDKVRAAITIDDRRAGERPAWLAAAQVVTTGAAGRDQAAEIVVQQITPYVDTDIRTEWVAAMRIATEAAQSAYRDAVARVTAYGAAIFAVPDQLGPLFPAAVTPLVNTTAAPVTMPATAPAPVAPPTAVTPAEPALTSPPPGAPPVSPSLPTDPGALGAATAPGPAMPSLPGAGLPVLPGLGGGLGDALGNLLPGTADVTGGPSPADPVPDRLDDSEHPSDDTKEPDSQDDSTSADAGDQDEHADDQPDEDQPDGTAADVADAAGGPVEEPTVAEPTPAPPVDAPPPSTPPEPVDEPTPCEIAADELPQVGQ